MKVVCPYTHMDPGVVACLDSWAPGWVPAFVGETDEDYWRLVCDLFELGEGFILVEHDVLIRENTVHELEECRRDFCQSPYPYGRSRGTIVGLGCVKFSAALIERQPDAAKRAWDPVPEMTDPKHPPGHWCRLDSRLTRVLVDAGELPHFDHSEVGHVGDGYPSHGCVPR